MNGEDAEEMTKSQCPMTNEILMIKCFNLVFKALKHWVIVWSLRIGHWSFSILLPHPSALSKFLLAFFFTKEVKKEKAGSSRIPAQAGGVSALRGGSRTRRWLVACARKEKHGREFGAGWP